MQLKLVASMVTVFLALSAHADGKRLLVVLKSQAQYQNAKVALQNGGAQFNPSTSAGNSMLRYAAIRGHLEKSLRNIKTLVVKVDGQQDVDRLKNNPDVALVEEEVFHPAPKPVAGYVAPTKNIARIPASLRVQSSSDKELSLPAALTPWGITAVKAFSAWPLANRGQGARVLVLDTGIDQDHPALSGNFEKGQDFVGDNQQPYPYADGEGHGTHVSGTIAALSNDDGFTGVAPSAKLLMGRVCSTKGCSNISIAQGINWGIEEKVDVISMSLGGAFATPGEREAVSSAAAAGISIVAAAGNDGTNRVGYPAALSDVIAVGAVDSKLAKAVFSQYGPELAVVAPGVAVTSSVPRGSGHDPDVQVSIDGAAPIHFDSLTLEGGAEVPQPLLNTLVDAGLGKPEDFANIDVKGKFALISRGEIKFIDKAQNAIAAGAVGAIFYNNEAGVVHGALIQDGSHLPLAAFMLQQQPGLMLKAALAEQKIIQAQVSVKLTDYASMDGTSMATPHVAGVVALMKAANHNLTPAMVKDILKRTAFGLAPNDHNEFGSGLVNADAAVREALLSAVPVTPAPPVVEPAPAP